MATLARESGDTAVYLVDEVTKTRRHVDAAEYTSLQALGWPAVKVVAKGLLAPYTVTTDTALVSTDDIAAAVFGQIAALFKGASA